MLLISNSNAWLSPDIQLSVNSADSLRLMDVSVSMAIVYCSPVASTPAGSIIVPPSVQVVSGWTHTLSTQMSPALHSLSSLHSPSSATFSGEFISPSVFSATLLLDPQAENVDIRKILINTITCLLIITPLSVWD